MKRIAQIMLLFQVLITIFVIMTSCSSSYKMSEDSRPSATNSLESLLAGYSPFLDSVLQHKDELNVKIIYTQIDRTKNGTPRFTDHFLNVDTQHYFYPASTVKFPVAVLALQRLNELRITGLDKNTTMITEAAGDTQTIVTNDPSTAQGPPTIAHYIKKILLVSDNDAFNRLYEFLGQEYINNSLHRMGYPDAQIIHRLDISLSEKQNRFTNPVRFVDTSGNIVYQQPAAYSSLVYAKRNNKLGKGYLKNGAIVNEPFDFSKKNRLSLQDLHRIMRSVIFPSSVPKEQRFNLTDEDYAFLYKYMSMLPRESGFPAYDSTEFNDSFAKMFLFSHDQLPGGETVRIFSKAGWAYGFLTDIAYIVDPVKDVEFMVSATIYCNNDGVFNDDKYDFDTIGYPFFRQLGRLLYDQEVKRKKDNLPDLSKFRINYTDQQIK